MKRIIGRGLVALLALTVGAELACAATLDLNSGVFYTNANAAEGSGRGIGVFMLEDFDLDSIGLQADLNALSFDAQVYASTNGSDTGALLATSMANLGGGAYQWWDVDLDYTLEAGNYYVLHFRPTNAGAGQNWLDKSGGGLDYYNDSGLPVDVGAFRLVNGQEGHTPPLNFGNFVHPDLRVTGNVVPEPSSLVLLGLGCLGVVVLRRRRMS